MPVEVVMDVPRHTGPQGHVEPFTVIDDPAAWTVADIMKDKSWIYGLTEEVWKYSLEWHREQDATCIS